MQRNENKLERAKKKQEDMDKRLREAGVYDERLSQEMKIQLLQLLEESYESARLEQEERQNLQRWEQGITEAVLNSSTHQESGGSSNSRCRKEEVDVEDAALVGIPAGQHTQQEAESGPSSDSLTRSYTLAEDENEDLSPLTLEQLDDPECQVIKTSTKDSPNTAVEAPQLVRRKCNFSAKDISSTPPSYPQPSPMAISPILSKSRMTPTNTITSTVMAGDSSNPNTVQPIHESPKLHTKRPPNPHVFLVPLTHSSSPRKNTISSTKKDLTSAGSATPTRKDPVFSRRENVSSRNSTIIEDSPSFQKNFTPSPRNSSHSSRNSTPTFSLDCIPSKNLPSGILTPSKDVSTYTSSKKSVTRNFSKNSATPSIRRNLTTSLVEDTSLTRNETFLVCPSSGASTTTSTSSTVTTTTTATTPTRAVTIPTTTTTTSDKEVGELGSPPDASSESDLDDKSTLRAAVFRSINVFSRSPVHKVSLRRKRPLLSEAAGKSFHLVPPESPQRCRSRILAMIDNTATRLKQYQTSLPALAWSPPLTVDPQLRDSLDRLRPVSRQTRQHQQVEGEMEREGSKQRHTRQAARYSREAPRPLLDSCRTEGMGRMRRVARGRPPGLRSGKRPATIPLPKVTSDSDSDLEIGAASSSLPSPPQGTRLKAGGTVLAAENKMESRPQQRRKTFRLDSGSEGSDTECSLEADVARMDNDASSCVSPGRRDAPASPTDCFSELCIIEEEQPHSCPSKLARPGIRRVARRGTRRPAVDPTGLVPSKLRKTHTINKENSTAGSIPQQTTHLRRESSDSTPTFEGASEWNAERVQNQEEEEGEEKMPCPICQRLYPLQEIEVHASDCVEMEEDTQQQHQQQQGLTHGPWRQRKMNEESPAAALSSSDKSTECMEKQRCSLCKDTIDKPEDLQLHIQSCHKMEEEDIFCPTSSSSSAIRQTYKRKVKVLARASEPRAGQGQGRAAPVRKPPC